MNAILDELGAPPEIDTSMPGYGVLRPPGERSGRSEPPPRPRAASLAVSSIRGVGRLSLPAIQRIGAGLGALSARLGTRERKNTRRNVQLAFPDWSPSQREAFVRRSMTEDGRMMAEHAALWTWPQERVMGLIRQVHGEAELRRAMDDGKGVLLAALHLGSIEALCIWCSTRYQLRSQYRSPRIRELDPFFREARERFGARLLPTGQGSVRLLLRGLKQGDLVGIPCDQDAGDGAGVFVPFFGWPANTTTLVSRLAVKSGARLFVAFAERLPGGTGYDLWFVPAPEAAYDDDVARSAAALNAVAERCIRRHPEQWIWSYRRWRVQPPDPALPQNEDQILATLDTP